MARKKKEVIEEVIEVVSETPAQEVPEQVYIYHTGDNLEKISQLLTGRCYMEYAILEYSGLSMDTLKDGDIIKWRV